MANEIWHNFTTGLTLYARIRRRTDSQVYDVDAGGDNFEAWSDGSVATYDLPLVDEDGSFYAVDFPSGISAGVYDVGIFQQSGGSPDVTDSVIAEGVMYWDGTAEINLSTMETLLDSILEDTGTTLETHLTDIKGTGFVKADDGLTELFHTGIDGDTGATLSAQMDAILTAEESVIHIFDETIDG